MQNTERQKFEQKWKSAFDGAETTPPDRVWNSVELNLAGDETAAMRKKVVFYQRLAAAMVAFAMTAGVYAYYFSSSNNERVTTNEQRATNQKPSLTEKPLAKTEAPLVKNKSKDDNNQAAQKETPVLLKREQKETLQSPALALAQEPVVASGAEEQTTMPGEITTANEQNGAIEETKEEKNVAEVVSPQLQEALEGPQEIVEPKHTKTQKESMWLALGGSAGNYTPNTPTATTPAISQSSYAARGPALAFATVVTTPKPQPKVGSSYSVGVGVGKRFGRFVIQTGVNLSKQQINYTSSYDTHTSFNTTKAAMSDYISQSSSLTFTNEYTVSSTMDIVSIPVQVGYMIIDRRLGWQINVGASNDFFLRNTLVDKSGQRDKFTQQAGSESPYRSLNYSALATTELSYRIGQHYRVSFVPGARYSVHSILKNTTDTGRPLILDVGFRFRYIFE
jgi:hypothetical protein